MDILLVEDNPTDVHLLRELLSDHKNAPSIHWVIDGHDALDYVFQKGQYQQATRPDMVMLDLGLPRVSGYDVLKKMKDHDEYKDIPVIVLTTSRNPLDKSQCEQLGADSFLSKPRTLKAFEELVQQMVSLEFPRLQKTA